MKSAIHNCEGSPAATAPPEASPHPRKHTICMGSQVGRGVPAEPPAAGPRRGSALILALWAVGLMSLMVASLAFEAHIQSRLTSYWRKRMQADRLAESGKEIAKMLFAKQTLVPARQPGVAPAEPLSWYLEEAQKLKDNNSVEIHLAVRYDPESGAVRLDPDTADIDAGDGTYQTNGMIHLRVEPVPAIARNINNLDGRNNTQENEVDENLDLLFTAGGVTEENADRLLEIGAITNELNLPELVDSFHDWIDADNMPRKDGAEGEDYKDYPLPHPRRTPNGPLKRPGELLWIKGFNSNPWVFNGITAVDPETKETISVSGIGNLITTYGDGRVNVNAVTQPNLLMTLPTMEPDVAEMIIDERGTNRAYSGWADLQQRLQTYGGRSLDPRLEKYIGFVSSIYRITSRGEVGGVSRTVSCVVQFDAQAQGTTKLLEQQVE